MYKWIDLLLRQTRFVFGIPNTGSILEGQLTGNCLLLGVEEGHGHSICIKAQKLQAINRWQQEWALGPGYHGKLKVLSASSC